MPIEAVRAELTLSRKARLGSGLSAFAGTMRTESIPGSHSSSSPGEIEYRSAIALGTVTCSFDVTFDIFSF